MRILIYGGLVPHTLSPEDIDDDHIPYGFVYDQARGAANESTPDGSIMGIVIAQDSADEDGLGFDVPVVDLDNFDADRSDASAARLVPIQYEQARAAWAALKTLYLDLPDASVMVCGDMDGISDLLDAVEDAVEDATEYEFH